MKNRKPIFLLIAIVMLQLIIAPIVEADETSYYKLLEPKAYKLKNSYKLENTGSNEALSIKATVLVGAFSSSPYQQNINYKVTPWPKYTYVDASGNIYAEVHVDKIKPGETKLITVEKELINGGVDYTNNIYEIDADYTEFQRDMNNRQYFEAGDKVEFASPEIASKAESFNIRQNGVDIAKDIYDFVNLYITYDKDPRYANKGALSAIKTARGVCDEYATLFTALCRALGLPARVATGYWLDEDMPLKSGVWNDVSATPHAWPEFYIPGAGWIPAEPTFQYFYNRTKRPNYDYFANMKADDIHLLQSYQQNDIKNDISISYSYYKPTEMEISFAEQTVMPISSVSASYAFTDIDGNWSRDYINDLYNQGILFAKQPGLYKPADNITRAEFSAYLVNALGLEPKTAGVSFKDIYADSEYTTFIKTAAAYKLITGNEQGYFKPNDPITRQDAATIMQRAIKLLNEEEGTLQEPQFRDASQVSSYAKEAVKLIYNMQIMTGKPGEFGNVFEPKSYTTRAEVAKILDNFINATE